ncbi:ATP-binding cassette domain-containing protein, partial [Nostoc sp. NIES-2111]
MRAAELALEEVSKTFEGVTAVERFSLAAPPGSYVVLLGPSGSGKSTVLSMLGGFVLPSAGRILIGGEGVSMVPPAKRPTASAFPHYALFPDPTAAGNYGSRPPARPRDPGPPSPRGPGFLSCAILERPPPLGISYRVHPGDGSLLGGLMIPYK